MFNKMLGAFVVIGIFLLSACTVQGDPIDLQIEPSIIPSALRVGESFDIHFSYINNEDLTDKVEITTSTPDIISLKDLKVTALGKGIATIHIKYPIMIDSADPTKVDYGESSTQIYVYSSRAPASYIREEIEFSESLHGTVMENYPVLNFESSRLSNNSKLLSLSGNGELILFNGFLFMTIGEILDKNPAYTLGNFIIKDIQFKDSELLYIKGFVPTHSKIVETENGTDTGVKNHLIDKISYDCGNEEELILDLDGKIIDKRTVSDSEICD